MPVPQRKAKALPEELAPLVPTFTFHGLCARILEAYYREAGFTKRPVIYASKV
jgi:hypothetical protein